jgi:sterol desaturase/sphingolipid hydroxylase (fatty acid hydroxylase superfamily)
VHYVHHRDQMWHHNFGLAVDWWDHVFRTYRTESCDELGDEAPGRLEIGWWAPLHAEGVWRRRARSL